MNIQQLAKQHGAENLVFRFAARPLNSILGMCFTSSADEQVVVEARAQESFNRYLADGHKMRLVPLDQKYAYEEFYISTFEGLCEIAPESYSVTVINNGG